PLRAGDGAVQDAQRRHRVHRQRDRQLGRVGRAGEGTAERDDLRLAGRRHHLAPHGRAVPGPHGHETGACPLPRRSAGADRRGRRARGHDLLQRRRRLGAAPGGPRADAGRGRHRPRAGSPGGSHRDGGRAAGAPVGRLVRRRGAAGHARPGGGAHRRRAGAGAGLARGAAALPRVGRRHRGRHPAGNRRFRGGRARPLGRGGAPRPSGPGL
ncbi:MAG: hypothetical protein AVDCRST_MAG08-2778, partial [uncultured Acetobacteraceae bacterium]